MSKLLSGAWIQFPKTARRISIGWKVLSEDDPVGELNMRDISKLVNFLYPSYSGFKNEASSLSAAPLLRMKFNNLVTNAANSKIDIGSSVKEDGLVGYINGGVSVNANVDSGFLTPKPGILVPRNISLKVDFTVLHTHQLGWAGSSTRTNGLFPYKTGGRFTDNVAVSRGHKGAENPNDKKPEEVQESRLGGLAGVSGGASASSAGSGLSDFDGASGGASAGTGQEEDQEASVAQAQAGRSDASTDNRGTATYLTEQPSDTNSSELEDHYNRQIN